MLAMEFYEVSKEEAKIERDWALKDEENYYHAAKSYSIIAAGIRGLTPHQPVADKIGDIKNETSNYDSSIDVCSIGSKCNRSNSIVG